MYIELFIQCDVKNGLDFNDCDYQQLSWDTEDELIPELAYMDHSCFIANKDVLTSTTI